ncbi:MAG: helix-turn-helix transcriptional regulator [Haliscomenobacter sp.]|nr:helix-turn-helix transcriptional regulator [Haliscomenobacter sp.]
MKTYHELLHTETYWVSKTQNDLFNAVEDYLTENGMTRSQFAKQLGVSKGYVSQVLSGNFDHRLSKLVTLSIAMGKAPVLAFEDLEAYAEKEVRGYSGTATTFPDVQKMDFRTIGFSPSIKFSESPDSREKPLAA